MLSGDRCQLGAVRGLRANTNKRITQSSTRFGRTGHDHNACSDSLYFVMHGGKDTRIESHTLAATRRPAPFLELHELSSPKVHASREWNCRS